MDGQITITDWLQSKIENKTVMDLTTWINSQGKAQYHQIMDVIRKSEILTDDDQIDRLTNLISVYVLGQSMGYMKYLKEEGAEEAKPDFERFREYCKHQSGTYKPEGEENFVRGCTFKNEQSATCWADWQKCNEQNCPFMKGVKK